MSLIDTIRAVFRSRRKRTLLGQLIDNLNADERESLRVGTNRDELVVIAARILDIRAERAEILRQLGRRRESGDLAVIVFMQRVWLGELMEELSS